MSGMKYYKKRSLNDWMLENVPMWRNTTLANALTKMGTPVTRVTIANWRKGCSPSADSKKIVNNLSELAGFNAELFFLTPSEEKRLKELSDIYDKDKALRILLD